MAEFLNSVGYNFDTAIFHFFGQIQCEIFNYISDFLALFGGKPAFFAYLILSFILCTIPRTRRYGVGLFFALAAGALVTNIALKPSVARERPYIGLVNSPFWGEFQQYWKYAGSHMETDFSFPSGHATVGFAGSVSMTIVSSQRKKKWIGLSLIVFAFFMALSRIYLMVHYPTDVLTGAIVGTIAGLIGGYSAMAIHLRYKRYLSEKEDKKLLNSEKEGA